MKSRNNNNKICWSIDGIPLEFLIEIPLKQLHLSIERQSKNLYILSNYVSITNQMA